MLLRKVERKHDTRPLSGSVTVEEKLAELALANEAQRDAQADAVVAATMLAKALLRGLRGLIKIYI